MSQPVNLNRFRKDKARAEKRVQADANALKHGRTKTEKEVDATRKAKAKRDLDGHRRET